MSNQDHESETTRNRVTWSLGQCATLACLLEAIAPKPGNVHRGSDFEDLTFGDLAVSGVAIAPAIDAAPTRPLGQTILAAVEATQATVGSNTNLGIILLLAPLAAAPREVELAAGLAGVFARLTPEDARDVYAAIRCARPGGLGKAPQADVHDEPPQDLLAAMALAAERDLIARQWTNGFEQVLEVGLPRLLQELKNGESLGDAIVLTHLQLMSRFPDSLIARKCGPAVAQQAADHAATVLTAGRPGDEVYNACLADFDFWLRSDGHRRNPGTTADLVAASLFAGLRSGHIQPPFRMAP